MFNRLIPVALLVFGATLSLGAHAQTSAQAQSPQPSVPGYVPRDALPNSLMLLSPAPDPHSATQARDDAAESAANAYRQGPRWALAALDADLSFPSAAGTFSCALGVNVSPETTPHLYTMLERVRVDAGRSTGLAKDQYNRQRPFVVVGGATCKPQDEADLRHNGSYPSGHSTIGWSWALVLAEADPDQGAAILARGRAFLQSRVVCNVHWLSDTEAGGLLAAAVVARLHDEPAFVADMKASEAEIQAAHAAGQKPSRDCAAEAAAIASAPNLQP
jgi:acid phosphatase (class A)